MYRYKCINSLYNNNQTILYNYIYYFFCCFNNFDEFYKEYNNTFNNINTNANANISFKINNINISKINNTYYSDLIQIFSKKINFINNIEEYNFTIENLNNFFNIYLINYLEIKQIFYIISSIFFLDYSLMFLLVIKRDGFNYIV